MPRTGEILVYLLVRKPHVPPYAGEYGFSGNRCERHVESVQGEPVYLVGPLIPRPVRHAVAEGAHVVEKMMSERRHDLAASCFRQFLRPVATRAAPCPDTGSMPSCIIIEAFAQSHLGTAFDRQLSAADAVTVGVASVLLQGRVEHKGNIAGHFPDKTFYHTLRRGRGQACSVVGA